MKVGRPNWNSPQGLFPRDIDTNHQSLESRYEQAVKRMQEQKILITSATEGFVQPPFHVQINSNRSWWKHRLQLLVPRAEDQRTRRSIHYFRCNSRDLESFGNTVKLLRMAMRPCFKYSTTRVAALNHNRLLSKQITPSYKALRHSGTRCARPAHEMLVFSPHFQGEKWHIEIETSAHATNNTSATLTKSSVSKFCGRIEMTTVTTVQSQTA